MGIDVYKRQVQISGYIPTPVQIEDDALMKQVLGCDPSAGEGREGLWEKGNL